MTSTPPILFLIFNRPDTTTTVFNRIREAKPTKLYVAADGARNEKEDELCKQTRAIIDQVDWECDVYTLFRDKNLGCKIAVSTAIDWFFQHEEQGIILEDDCLPDLTFFPFCQELLTKYQNDDRVGHIGGNCFFPNKMDNSLSYKFCSVPHVWGWATWRRVWEQISIDFNYWEEHPNNRRSLFINKWEEIYFSTFISDALQRRNGLNPWAVFYYYSLRLQNQLSIYPTKNLVTNIGFGMPHATHTKKINNKYIIESDTISFPLNHPQYMLPDKDLNESIIRNNFFSWKRTLRYFTGRY